jgi:dienelactone hydrolase
MTRALRLALGLAAVAVMALALWTLAGESRGLAVTEARVGTTPVTVFALPGAPPAPAVVIAHGFAGSERLMAPFATTLARAGYVAVTYDALGHGRNPAPLRGDVTEASGATARLLEEIAAVAAFARTLPEADGRLAVLGHSMASDIVVRHARADPDTDATIAVSMFSPEVTATEPRNLLVITGAWEAGLTDEALRVAGLAAGGAAEPFVTYGDPAAGTGRRAVLAPRVEHVGVLYSPTSLAEARAWLDATFGRDGGAARLDDRGPWILAYVAAAMTAAWAAAPLLPRVAEPRSAPTFGSRRFALAALVPAVVTPFLAALVPAGLLPVPVADYLAVHFFLYGAIGLALLARLHRLPPLGRPGVLAAAAVAFAAAGLSLLYLPIDRFVTVFVPGPHRVPLVLVLAAGLLPYFLADEALTRGPGAPRFAYPLTKLALLASLGLALALDLERLFFLVIVLPVVLAFFLLFGLLGRWTARATGSPWPAALAQALLFAWALAVTFPILG